MYTNLTINNLIDGSFDNHLYNIYGNDISIINHQRNRYKRAVLSFVSYFGDSDVEIFTSPGRTEICGNHTDHQKGKVLAASVNLDMLAIVTKTNDRIVEVISEGYPSIKISLDDLAVHEALFGTTESLIRGMLYCFKINNYNIGGFKAYITSDVISGAGLSSSAAFEALIGTILSSLYNDSKIADVDIAIWGQYVENVYFGKPCGLMDQIACSVGGFVYIDFATMPPVIEKIDNIIEDEGYSLCIVDTKGSHADLTEDYAAITSEMKSVAAFFEKETLGDITADMFFDHLPQLCRRLPQRAVLRALHLFEENKRVDAATCALKNSSIDEFLSVIKDSGDSSITNLQNIYSTNNATHQPISLALSLSKLYLKDNGVCRVHGGGFAGTIQVFVKTSYVYEYKDYIEKIFGVDACHILRVRNYGACRHAFD